MNTKFEIPDRYRQAFIDAGWYENRRMDTDDYVFELKWYKYQNLDYICELFAEFGDLTIKNPDYENAMYSVEDIRFSASEIRHHSIFYKTFSEVAGEQMMPLASGRSHPIFLLGEKGGYYGYYDGDYLWKYGETFSEFILAIFTGKNWEVLIEAEE